MECVHQDHAQRDLAHYLTTGQFTDAVICYSGREQKVHRIVLARGSDYFSSLFLSSFREAHDGSIDLSGDDSNAVANLIAHLYGHEVLVTGIDCSEDGFQLVKTQIETFVVASKYLVPSLCTKIQDAFANNIVRLLGRVGLELNFKYLDRIARFMYIDRDVEAQSLQPPLTELLVKHATELTNNAEFKELMLDVPELSFHLLTVLAQPKKLPSLKIKKRKL